MKKIIFISIFLLIGLRQSIYSQNYCYTPTTTEVNNFSTTTSSNLNITGPVTLRVYFHVIRRSDETGGYLPNQVEESLHILQGHFNPHQIFFAWDGCINYINDDYFFNANSIEQLNEIFTIDRHNDGVDLYLNLNDSFSGGAANGIGPSGSSELWVSGSDEEAGPSALNSTISHEMGHVFFLWHTFHGCEEDGTWEMLDGSNCDVAGDEVCATNRDPGMRAEDVNSDCEWIAFSSGCINTDLPPQDFDSYMPDTRNIMSYSRISCKTEFKADEDGKEGQGTRMLKKIRELPHLQDCIIIGSLEMDCECEIADVIIDENTIFDEDLHISGNLKITNGAELIINSTIHFNSGYGIDIIEGSKLTIDGGTLDACGEKWKGISLVDGELTASNSNIFNAQTGIRAQNGTTLDLINVDVLGNSGWAGVQLLGTVDLISFEEMKIEDYYFGIYVVNNGGFCDFTQGEINNTTYGMYLYKSFTFINNYEINATHTAIYMNACDGSALLENHIGFGRYGLNARNTHQLSVVDNTIGYYTQTGRNAIQLLNCQGVDISDNSAINASQFGIRAFQSNIDVSGNTIEVQGHNNTVGGGIQLISNAKSNISDNLITANQSSFGIESIVGQANNISHNEVSVFSTIGTRTAAIRSMGSMSENIANNIVDGLANVTGIIAQNSTDNTFECNEITNTDDGIAIYYNSAGQDIRGNKFLDSEIDLSIRSRIGLQNHTGNEFINGTTRAIDLSAPDILDSRFFVNETFVNHMPSDPLPANGEWFVPQNSVTDYYECTEEAGPFVKLHDDEDKLSDYFDAVKSLENEQPNVFNTRLYHLLKYEQIREGYALPNYIGQDIVIANLCSLQELADVSSRLEGLMQSNEGENGETQSNLNNIYIFVSELLNQGNNSGNINEQLSLLTLDIEDRLIADSLSLLDMKGDLENINCTDNYTEMWKAIYTMYLDFIQTGEVSEKNQKDLVEYSKECSDEYGDVVHIARALANTFDDTYFDIYDDCMKEGEEKIKLSSTTTKPLVAFLHPNPSKGTVVLHTEDQVSGKVRVVDLKGKIVYTAIMDNESQHTMNLNLDEGLYFIYLTNESGEVLIEKIIITK